MMIQKKEKKISPDPGPVHPALHKLLHDHATRCVHCGLCVRECSFLQKHGSPGSIAETFDQRIFGIAFGCSLCGLCTAVCPPKIGLDPAAFFLAIRREAVARGVVDFSRHRGILFYERAGNAPILTFHGLPRGCDTVFFPGCALPGTRPTRVRQLFDHLRQTIPRLGTVLACCNKPSHDLGRQQSFQVKFGKLTRSLLEKGVKRILVACPNCHRIFSEYGQGLQVITVYEHLDMTVLPRTPDMASDVTVHDPCGTRTRTDIHQVIRRLAEKKSLQIHEMPHHGTKTICCGEGGSAGCVCPEFARKWGELRSREAEGMVMLTYCAGCTEFLTPLTPAVHILDLLFEPELTLAGRTKSARTPWTYLNRWRLKRFFQKILMEA
ncbi:(Fe-S)-binding protein [Desulfolithobacter sp.]